MGGWMGLGIEEGSISGFVGRGRGFNQEKGDLNNSQPPPPPHKPFSDKIPLLDHPIPHHQPRSQRRNLPTGGLYLEETGVCRRGICGGIVGFEGVMSGSQ